jgi:hypothetical protein
VSSRITHWRAAPMPPSIASPNGSSSSSRPFCNSQKTHSYKCRQTQGDQRPSGLRAWRGPRPNTEPMGASLRVLERDRTAKIIATGTATFGAYPAEEPDEWATWGCVGPRRSGTGGKGVAPCGRKGHAGCVVTLRARRTQPCTLRGHE